MRNIWTKTLQLILNIGGNVILKVGGIIEKEDSKFYPTLFKVIEIKYTAETVEGDNDKTYTCHIAFFQGS